GVVLLPEYDPRWRKVFELHAGARRQLAVAAHGGKTGRQGLRELRHVPAHILNKSSPRAAGSDKSRHQLFATAARGTVIAFGAAQCLIRRCNPFQGSPVTAALSVCRPPRSNSCS